MTQNDSLRGWARATMLVALLMAALALGFARPAMAAEEGRITITQHDPSQRAIGGGKAAIYQVGVINGSSYQYVGDFASIGDDLTSHIPNDPDKGKVDSSYLDRLEAIAKQSSGPLQTADIDSRGVATFSNLQPGVYLMVQAEAAPGYNSFDRFLVTIPWYGKDQTDPYHVNASPKLDPVTTTSSSTPSSGPGTTTPTSGTTTPTSDTTTPASDVTPAEPGGTLPQTGQLWWPVAVLAVAGVALFLVGRHANGRRA